MTEVFTSQNLLGRRPQITLDYYLTRFTDNTNKNSTPEKDVKRGKTEVNGLFLAQRLIAFGDRNPYELFNKDKRY